MTTESKPKTASELVDEHEEQMLNELNVRVAKSCVAIAGTCLSVSKLSMRSDNADALSADRLPSSFPARPRATAAVP